MRRLFLACVVLVTASLSAQTADEIIDKYIKRVGGLERIESIQTLRRTGKYTGGGGFEATIVEENARPSFVR